MKKAVSLSVIVTILIFSAVLFAQVGAEPGKLDPTFGEDGATLVDFSGLDDYPTTIFLQEDGKVLAAGWADVWPGDFGTIRLLRDGSPDPSFGDGGRVTTAFSDNPDNVDAAWSVTAAPDGRIYVSGETCDADYIICDFATVAYNEDGTLDESFGDGGKIIVSTGADTDYAWPRRDILQDDGKLIAAGVAVSEDGSVDIALRRHNLDGSLDESFGTDGVVIQDFDDKNNYPQDILALPGGKILVVGGFGIPTDNPFNYIADVAFMALFNSDGTLDTTFGGGDGLVTFDYMGIPLLNKGGHYGSDGMIYVVGDIQTVNRDCTLRRFDSFGVADETFGTDGWAVIDTDTDDGCWDIRETPDHKLVFDGGAYSPLPEAELQSAGRTAHGRRGMSLNSMQDESPEMTLIGRYLMDGTPDETFGPDGLVVTLVYPTGSRGYGLAVQPDGKLLTISEERNLEDRDADYGVIRFLGDGPAAQVFAPAVMGP